jgi:hypothetical protein
MSLFRTTCAAAAIATALAGCSMFNSLTGQVDNTVLPGQREDAIPGRSTFPEKPDVAQAPGAGQSPPSGQSKCSPDDPACQPASGDDVYSDPQ